MPVLLPRSCSTLVSRSDSSAPLLDLKAAARSLGIAVSPQRLVLFESYVATLLVWRDRLSLTGASTAGVIVRRHIIDSLHVAPYLHPGGRAADIGSGAGFPGIPLAIVRPGADVVLIESRRKRANFLREVIRRIGLSNATVLEDRAEALQTQSTAAFDLTTARALGSVELFLTLSQPILKPSGQAVAMKGSRGAAEAQAPHPRFSAPDVIAYTLPDHTERTLLIFKRLP